MEGTARARVREGRSTIRSTGFGGIKSMLLPALIPIGFPIVGRADQREKLLGGPADLGRS